jgi:uncharacterized protein YuzE
MYLTYDQEADAVYVYFSDRPVARTEELSDVVNVDYDSSGDEVGVEFLDVSQGIDLASVPRRSEVAQLLEERHFRLYA